MYNIFISTNNTKFKKVITHTKLIPNASLTTYCQKSKITVFNRKKEGFKYVELVLYIISLTY